MISILQRLAIGIHQSIVMQLVLANANTSVMREQLRASRHNSDMDRAAVAATEARLGVLEKQVAPMRLGLEAILCGARDPREVAAQALAAGVAHEQPEAMA